MKTVALTTLLMTVAAESPGFTQPIVVEDMTAPSALVSVSDLNLQSDAGRQTLDRRVRRAADLLCSEPGKTDLDRLAETRDCYQVAAASARFQIMAFNRSAATAVSTASVVHGR